MKPHVTHPERYSALLGIARRLETDRAALMAAVEALLKDSPTANARIDASRALATARANFPIP